MFCFDGTLNKLGLVGILYTRLTIYMFGKQQKLGKRVGPHSITLVVAVVLITDLEVISLFVQIVVVVVLLLLFIAAAAATASLLYMRGVVFCPSFVIQSK